MRDPARHAAELPITATSHGGGYGVCIGFGIYFFPPQEAAAGRITGTVSPTMNSMICFSTIRRRKHFGQTTRPGMACIPEFPLHTDVAWMNVELFMF
ncbi:hypothetical protein EGT07_02125 [Herbaspirillum sp. HC18]|nr:hypothetical protein EGT07_02125 [Herbaspirillum sp. HC18]